MPTSESVCLKCGAYKDGTWKTCPECKHKPKDHDDMARHLLLSSHYFKPEQLKEYSECIKRGDPVGFEPKLLEMVLKIIREKESGKKELKSWVFKIYGTFLLIVFIIFLAWFFR